MRTVEEIREMIDAEWKVSPLVCDRCEKGCGFSLGSCVAWYPVGTILVVDEVPA